MFGRKESSDSGSDSSEEGDRDSWFEQRRRIREALARGETAPLPADTVKPKSIKRCVMLAR